MPVVNHPDPAHAPRLGRAARSPSRPSARPLAWPGAPIATALALLALAPAAQAAAGYRLTDLAPPPGYGITYSSATELNDLGVAAGHVNSASYPVAAAWAVPAGDSAVRAGAAAGMPGARNGITGLNDAGLLLGNYAGPYGSVAMVGDGGAWSQLPWPDARYTCCGRASAINNSDVIVGDWFPTGLSSATRWQRNASGDWVAESLGGGQGVAVDISDTGLIAGNTVNLGAVMWLPDRTLVDVGPVDPGRNHSEAAAINAAGTVVGWGYAADGRRQGYVWNGGQMTVLGGLDGWQGYAGASTWISRANDVNDAGWVVGHAMTAQGQLHGFVWHDGQMTDLNSLVSPDDPFFALPQVDATPAFQIVDATAINDRGQILATASFRIRAANGAVQQAQHSFLLTPLAPVPEPAPAVLLGVGLAALGLRLRAAARAADGRFSAPAPR